MHERDRHPRESNPAGSEPVRASAPPPVGMLRLQMAAGNRAVASMLASHLTVQRRRRGRTADAPAPEQTSSELTGLYDPLINDARQIRTLTLNQAGRLLVGWFRVHQQVRRVEMDIGSDNDTSITASYVMRHDSPGHRPFVGTALFRREGRAVTVILSGDIKGELRRVSTEAAASESSIGQLPPEAARLIRARTRSPLTAVEQGHVLRSADLTREMIGHYLRSDDRHEKRFRASSVSAAVSSILTRLEAPGQVELSRRYFAGALVTTTQSHGNVTRSDWDWLMIILMTHANRTALGRSALGLGGPGKLTPKEGLPTHRFQWRLWGVGASGDIGIGAGAYMVRLEFKETEPDAWSSTYTGFMGQLSGGASVGVSMGFDTGWNEATSALPYKAPNLAGWFDVLEGGAKWAAGVGGGASSSVVSLTGDKSLPPLILVPSTWSIAFGIHAGVELSGSIGRLSQSSGPRKVAAKPAPEPGKAEASYLTGTAAHFGFDDPSLTEDGRLVLRRFLADERRAISSPGSKVVVVGHASTDGKEKRNEELARLRAVNTTQAIRDIAGAGLACDLRTESYGERLAGIASTVTGADPEARNPAWRRADIFLNGQLRVRLTADAP